ncbi:MAG: hypothetical protein M1517_06825 [Deltaproteobacteria bacterium]|nr:hypothetical protein [Deltaproteobacteria bacterium]
MGLIEQKERVFSSARKLRRETHPDCLQCFRGTLRGLLLSRYGNTEALWGVTPFTEKSFVLRAEEKTLSS